MNAAEPNPAPRPYAEQAARYYAAGWTGVLPVAGKFPPPKGWTGANGATPSFADVSTWCDGPEGALNLGLRLPRHVLGVDVDTYGGKLGSATLAAAQGQHGALPPTWTSTSRQGESGIRLFAVPEGRAWLGELPGGGVELIQYRHRYVMAWPSVHPSGERYRWLGPDGMTRVGEIPPVDGLPDLPLEWVAAFSPREERDIARADLADAEALAWLAEHGQGEPCPIMAAAKARTLHDLTGGGSRHEAITRGTARVAHLIVEGHVGGLDAMGAISSAFTAATLGERRPGEITRAISGAVRVASVVNVAGLDICGTAFASPPRDIFGPARPFAAPDLARLDVRASERSSATEDPLGGGHSASEIVPAVERSSWAPIDLDAVLDGDTAREAPSILTRADGACLFYRGRVNGLLGASESGKTWIGLLAVAQQLDAGAHVLVTDFEDTAEGTVARLESLGVSRAVIRERLHYVAPDEPPAPVPLGQLMAAIARHAPSLVVLDGVNAAMSLAGLDPLSNADATTFYQQILKPIAELGPALVTIDHTPKSKVDESVGGIGAQAKRAMTSGCAIRVDKRKEFGPGVTGYLKMTVDKDRLGMVRAIAQGARVIGTAVIESIDSGAVSIAITLPDAATTDAEGKTVFRRTVLMGRISRYLDGRFERPSKAEICRSVTGNAEQIGKALDTLVAEGFVVIEVEGQAHLCRLVRPFDAEVEDGFGPVLPTSSLPLPTSSRKSARKEAATSSCSSPPYGGMEEDAPSWTDPAEPRVAHPEEEVTDQTPRITWTPERGVHNADTGETYRRPV